MRRDFAGAPIARETAATVKLPAVHTIKFKVEQIGAIRKQPQIWCHAPRAIFQWNPQADMRNRWILY
jgi:hypothetical protein